MVRNYVHLKFVQFADVEIQIIVFYFIYCRSNEWVKSMYGLNSEIKKKKKINSEQCYDIILKGMNSQFAANENMYYSLNLDLRVLVF